MSFRVNTNIAAMGALRSVGQNATEFNKSITRLSTGLRISTAADDPAGLIISENFRTQINSMGQAVRNNQDAINYAKTAEGALDEVNRLLREARTLTVASANTGILDSAQIQANQAQLNSIVESISRIAQNTQFGTKKLLDGSAGVVGGITGSNVSQIFLTGQWNGSSLSQQSSITMAVTSAATKAEVAGATFAFGTTTMTAGTFSINGTTFNVSGADTLDAVVARINAASSSTGVQATFTTGGAVTLTQLKYGASNGVNVTDSAGVILAAAGTLSDSGSDAVANVTVDTNGATAGGLSTVVFTGGRGGDSALTLSDNYGNSITLTETGNGSAATTQVGQLFVGSAQFQVGANQGQTVLLSLGNYASANLGLGVVSGKNLSNLDITSATGANEAMSVIDAAVAEVSRVRGNIGSFQRNVLESNIRSLGVAKENLAATESMIRDVDVAEEMTQFTKLQILQQSGLSVLAQANAAPQAILSLLRG